MAQHEGRTCEELVLLMRCLIGREGILVTDEQMAALEAQRKQADISEVQGPQIRQRILCGRHRRCHGSED